MGGTIARVRFFPVHSPNSCRNTWTVLFFGVCEGKRACPQDEFHDCIREQLPRRDLQQALVKEPHNLIDSVAHMCAGVTQLVEC